MEIQEFRKIWNSQNNFSLQTSGTTGNPKEIILEKNKIVISCNYTKQLLNHIKPNIYCCLPTNKVSGFMQLARSTVWNCPITVVAPSVNPLEHYDMSLQCTMISLSPMQLYNALQNTALINTLNTFKIVLIGGGDINFFYNWNALTPAIYHTYGMTETYSHIAYRDVKTDNYFTVFKHVNIDINDKNCLKIQCEITNNNWLQTNDMVEIMNATKFTFLGRIDNVINTGGIKINAEMVENKIMQFYNLEPNAIMVYAEKNELYGEMVCIKIINKYKELITHFSFLEKFEIPKKILYTEALEVNAGGKLRRG